MKWAIAATVFLHGVLAVTVSRLPASTPPPPPTVITVREVKRPPPPKPLPPPPPAAIAPAPAPAPAVKPAPTPKPKAAPPTPAPPSSAPTAPSGPAPALTMGNGPAGNGPALPRAQETAAPPPPVRKTLEAKPVETGGCEEAIVKPKPISVVQPAFTQEARDAQITGKVRVEITISKDGAVTSVKVIAGLGHGLDEAAVEAAKASTFSPATRCGVAVETTFTIGMRFQ